MGFPSRLDGKHTPLPSDETETCPNCHRKFPVYEIVRKGKYVVRECPFCEYEFKIDKDKFAKKQKRREG